ncbi:hypothetical protein IV54_GL000350 [Levilactobacillus paucivorans]|uniref:Uncharacterized protein n=1 Tax=Levilactobacillus paucivorans TaxID=616990 RepID=A0A0R2M335_9LACO|nr:hypothetical protein IV54_GL000350 [Levilactobacillus paucivorans]
MVCENGIGDPKKTPGAKGIWKFKVGVKDSGKPTRLYNRKWSQFVDGLTLKGIKDTGVEAENIQIIGGDIYLSVTYHDVKNGVSHMAKNRLYHFDKTLI